MRPTTHTAIAIDWPVHWWELTASGPLTLQEVKLLSSSTRSSDVLTPKLALHFGDTQYKGGGLPPIIINSRRPQGPLSTRVDIGHNSVNSVKGI